MGFEAIVCFRGDAFVALGICHGVADSLFPVCLGFSLIVMYDAIGVRRHAGMQAEVVFRSNVKCQIDMVPGSSSAS
ncbi:hypothetical protein K1719_039324 [Acacia pycnantha]|nr:hypothetical protein K1719_039324 [Acacia pycnantha]